MIELLVDIRIERRNSDGEGGYQRIFNYSIREILDLKKNRARKPISIMVINNNTRLYVYNYLLLLYNCHKNNILH